MKAFLTAIAWLGLTSTVLGYNTLASPRCTLHVLDQGGKPIAGLHVVREWDGSDNKKGQAEVVTDDDGMAVFEKVVFKRSVIKRVFKPFLILVPASCGPEWETYSSTKISVSWPGGYSLKPIPDGFKPDGLAFSNKEDTHIYCSKPVEYIQNHLAPESGQNFIEISFFNRKKNKEFDLTLNLLKRNAVQ